LGVAFVEDLKRKLREMGYSEKAVEEILKWYR
jgi:SOS response regulatory protein OraA/RecX